MASTIKQVAEQAIKEVQRLEVLNRTLQAQINYLKKDASLVSQTVDSLTKCGFLAQSDKQQASNILSKDSNASLRAIKGLCQIVANANTFVKQASCDLDCGSLVTENPKNIRKIQGVDSAWQAVHRVLSSSKY